MARSKKKNNISGVTICDSEKDEKRIANRSLRRKNKQEVKMGREVFTIKKENSNVWDFGKDGRQIQTDPLYLRK